MYVLYIFLIINVSSFLEACNVQFQNLSDSILCRNCGSDLLSTDSFISKLSPVSLYSFNDTIFNKEEILVQVLPKDLVLEFPVVTATSSDCVAVGEWQDDDYWFPGYYWKACGCSKCGAFVGWIFEAIDPLSVVIPEKFFGFIPAHLVSKSFTDSLIKYPELKQYDKQNSI